MVRSESRILKAGLVAVSASAKIAVAMVRSESRILKDCSRWMSLVPALSSDGSIRE